MSMSMPVIVSMPMAMSMPMVVPMPVIVPMCVSMIEGEYAYKIDKQTYKTDQQKPMGVHLRRIQKSLNSLRDNADRDQDQEHAICKST